MIYAECVQLTNIRGKVSNDLCRTPETKCASFNECSVRWETDCAGQSFHASHQKYKSDVHCPDSGRRSKAIR
jgi:hypothetical protein